VKFDFLEKVELLYLFCSVSTDSEGFSMNYQPQNPLIVQGDGSVLLEVDNPQYAGARDVLARFAELEKSPEYIHTYRITPLSLWNAASSGQRASEILDGLNRYCKYPLPDNVRVEIESSINRYGLVKLVRRGDDLLLTVDDPVVLVEIGRRRELAAFILEEIDSKRPCSTLAIPPRTWPGTSTARPWLWPCAARQSTQNPSACAPISRPRRMSSMQAARPTAAPV
jgi:hypothetical protein